jgi:microsomal dipeptidase-like Zn-dependent dipeptidase
VNELFLLHTHYIPQTLLSNCEVVGAVIVPEYNPKLTFIYYGENKRFNNIEESLEFISTHYQNTRLFFSLENLNVLSDYKKIPEYKRLGLVMLQLYHNNDNKYFCFKTGLTDDGRNLLKVMEENSIVLDLSHLDDTWAKKLASLFGGRIVVSHCACNDVYTKKEARSNTLSTKTIELLGKREVLFGIAFVNDIIASTSHAQDEDDNTLMKDLLIQIKIISETAGGHSVALGPDFFALDYFSHIFGVPLHIPDALFHNAGYERIKQSLIDAGLHKNEIDLLFYKNADRFLQ